MLGSVDGMRLDRFVVGLTYDVGTTLGNYLMSSGFARPIQSDIPALVVPLADVKTILVRKTPVAKAADASSRGRKAKRKKR
jgi:hypothetical protein